MTDASLRAAALAVRSLSMDAIEAAGSGHPGLPMGLAELGALLYGETMNYNPEQPKWPNRDRFVLSAGHGSMLQYSLLHLAGFNLPIEQIQNFRQLDSLTPGHPEYEHTEGVETTTGPLGQGFANAVGLALAETMSAARFNTEEHKIFDHYTYCIAGDGCMMEGVTSEAASLAGHLKLGKLVVFYDDNQITIDGSTDLSFSEDVQARFRSYGWHVQSGSAYDMDVLRKMIQTAKDEGEKPSLIALRSVIGKGAPNKQGSSSVHGAPLGQAEMKAAKEALGLDPELSFQVPQEAYWFFSGLRETLKEKYNSWQKMYDSWKKSNPDLHQEFRAAEAGIPLFSLTMPDYSTGDSIATRSAGQKSLQAVSKAYPCLVGGSADLAESNKTKFTGVTDYSSENRSGRSINFGVREHAMGAVSNGVALYGLYKVFCSTFLVFSDYMRPAIRLAGIMNLPVVYVFTHDSIYVGEDGPTHQPVEQIAALRLIPGLQLFRPGDAEECNLAWQLAMERSDGPVALALTRQNLEVYRKADPDWKNTARGGAYIVQDCEGTPDIILAASGSEVGMALKAAEMAGSDKLRIRVVSILCRERFLQQDQEYRSKILPQESRVITVEAGSRLGWESLCCPDSKDHFSIDRYGLSGKAGDVGSALGFTAEQLAERLKT